MDDDKIAILKKELEEFLLDEFGTPCPDYNESCILCRVWRYHNFIFDAGGEETDCPQWKI